MPNNKVAKNSPKNAPKNNDPLLKLFEHHLLTRSHEDAAKFTREVATEYVNYLDSTPAHVPFYARTSVMEDLELETHEMLVRKMYGCATVSSNNLGVVMRVNWEESLEALDFCAPANSTSKEQE